MKKMVMFLVVVMVLVMGIGMSVMAASEKEASYQISNEEYKELEQECLYDVKQILLEKGRVTVLLELIGDGLLTITDAALRLNITEEEVKKLLEEK